MFRASQFHRYIPRISTIYPWYIPLSSECQTTPLVLGGRRVVASLVFIRFGVHAGLLGFIEREHFAALARVACQAVFVVRFPIGHLYVLRGRVEDTQKHLGRIWAHRLHIEAGEVAVGDAVHLTVDHGRRAAIRAIGTLRAGGNTDLFAGWLLAAEHVAIAMAACMTMEQPEAPATSSVAM